jgi:D-glycero-D-manno-heptose 1,7-bisphosphate phosphatase
MSDPCARVVVLDRDGVINVDVPGRYICKAEDWVAIDGSLEAMARLNRAGFDIYIVSNQSGIGRGLFTEQDLAEMHAKLVRELGKLGGSVTGWFYCPHTPDANCHCRKPATGLLERVAAASRSNLDGVAFVGDKWTDLQAAEAMRMRGLLVGTGHGKDTLSAHCDSINEYFDDLAAAADALIDGAAVRA